MSVTLKTYCSLAQPCIARPIVASCVYELWHISNWWPFHYHHANSIFLLLRLLYLLRCCGYASSSVIGDRSAVFFSNLVVACATLLSPKCHFWFLQHGHIGLRWSAVFTAVISRALKLPHDLNAVNLVSIAPRDLWRRYEKLPVSIAICKDARFHPFGSHSLSLLLMIWRLSR